MSDSLRNDDTLTTADLVRRPADRQVRSEVLYRGPVPVPDKETERIAPDTETVQVPSNRPSAADGAAGATTSSAASSAPIRRFAWFVMYRPRRVSGQPARLISPCLGDGASCSWNDNSPILMVGPARRRPCNTMSHRRVGHRRRIFDNIMTLRL